MYVAMCVCVSVDGSTGTNWQIIAKINDRMGSNSTVMERSNKYCPRWSLEGERRRREESAGTGDHFKSGWAKSRKKCDVLQPLDNI